MLLLANLPVEQNSDTLSDCTHSKGSAWNFAPWVLGPLEQWFSCKWLGLVCVLGSRALFYMQTKQPSHCLVSETSSSPQTYSRTSLPPTTELANAPEVIHHHSFPATIGPFKCASSGFIVAPQL